MDALSAAVLAIGVAAIAAIASAGGSIIGGRIAARSARETVAAQLEDARAARTQAQDHERAMARDARTQDRRARAYVLMLEHASHLSLWADRSEPMIGPKPDPPEPIPDSELIKINAMIGAYASSAVRAIALDFKAASNAVQARIWQVRDERANPRATDDGWRQLDAARKQFREAIERLEEQINAELAGDDAPK